jgi:hypothetical protein
MFIAIFLSLKASSITKDTKAAGLNVHTHIHTYTHLHKHTIKRARVDKLSNNNTK